MTTQINQLIEQIKLDLNNYQSQLSEIELQSTKEKERLLAAIKAEEAEIKSLLTEYRNIKQKNEVDVVKSSFETLADFKQNLLAKIKSETSNSNTLPTSVFPEQKLENSSTASLNSDSEGDKLPKKSNPQLEENENNSNQKTNIQAASASEVTIAKLIRFIDQTAAQDLIKLYPANVAHVVSDFDATDTVVRDKLLEHYRQKDPQMFNSLIKLYQKPIIKQQVTIPNTQKINDQDRKYHNFIVVYYPNALPFFWYLVSREPDSIRYVVMECAKDHIIYTNEIDPDNNSNQLSISFQELLDLNNQASIEVYLRDIFICFHPQRGSSNSNSKNKYFDYLDNIIVKESTLEHSKILKFWNQMNKVGYQTVAASDFPVKLSDS